MSSRKRSKSKERRGQDSKNSKLRMDSKAPAPRITGKYKSFL